MVRQQLKFFSEQNSFGGCQFKKYNPKKPRPISIKKPMHLVLRSEIARGPYSFLNPFKAKKIREIVNTQGTLFGVKIYRQANSGNHLHLLILPRSTRAYKGFVRSISGLIARITLGVERGKAKGIKFWDARPYSRIVTWGREYTIVKNYLLQNILEAIGFIPYTPRKNSS